MNLEWAVTIAGIRSSFRTHKTFINICKIIAINNAKPGKLVDYFWSIFLYEVWARGVKIVSIFGICCHTLHEHLLHLMVPLAGIELATFSLRMNCSTNWAKAATGENRGIRTLDTFTNTLLIDPRLQPLGHVSMWGQKTMKSPTQIYSCNYQLKLITDS